MEDGIDLGGVPITEAVENPDKQEPVEETEIDPDVLDALNKFEQYKSYALRVKWEENVIEDMQFANNVQYSATEEKELRKKTQAPITMNVINPVMDTAISILTAHYPAFIALPVDDSDVHLAKLKTKLVAYVLNYNKFKKINRTFVRDYFEKSMGVLQVYPEIFEDGAGEIKIINIFPLDVIPDPYCRDPQWEDADRIFVFKRLTKDRLKFLYPKLSKVIDGIKGDTVTPGYSTTTRIAIHGESFPNDLDDTLLESERLTLIEQYRKIRVKRYIIGQLWNNMEYRMSEEEFLKYLEKEVIVVASREGHEVIENPQAMKEIEQLQAQYGDMIVADPQRGFSRYQEGVQYPPNAEILEFRQATKKDLLNEGSITAREYYDTGVEMMTIVGRTLLNRVTLPISKYPLIVVPNRHTNTPYPLSDVRMTKTIQEALNVILRLVILWTTNAASTKVLLPTGSVENVQQFTEDWSKPNAVLEYDPTEGKPMQVQPAQLPGEVALMPDRLKSYIEYVFGVFPLMQGNPERAPRTIGGTMAIEEFGQRRLKGKMQDLEIGWQKLCELIFEYIPYVFTKRKIVRLVQPGEEPEEFVINDVRYDRFTNEEIERVADVTDTTSKYDIEVVSGSTLSSNKWLELQTYLEAYKEQLIDRYEVLKKSNIFDTAGVMKRIGEIGKMKEMIQQLQEQLEKTAKENEQLRKQVINTQMRVATTKATAQVQATEAASQAEMKSTVAQTKASLQHGVQLFLQRLEDNRQLMQRKIEEKKVEKSEKKK